ncbi:hypothetical protein ACRAWD_15435 [Caulobacter segnis]
MKGFIGFGQHRRPPAACAWPGPWPPTTRAFGADLVPGCQRGSGAGGSGGVQRPCTAAARTRSRCGFCRVREAARGGVAVKHVVIGPRPHTDTAEGAGIGTWPSPAERRASVERPAGRPDPPRRESIATTSLNT